MHVCGLQREEVEVEEMVAEECGGRSRRRGARVPAVLALERADLLGGEVAGEDGHLDVHQDEVELGRRRRRALDLAAREVGGDALLAILGGDHLRRAGGVRVRCGML